MLVQYLKMYPGPPLVWLLQHPQFLKLWVLAPVVFGNFSHISIIFHKNCLNVMSLVIPWQKEICIKHPHFEIPNVALDIIRVYILIHSIYQTILVALLNLCTICMHGS